jgi:ribosomal protein S10
MTEEQIAALLAQIQSVAGEMKAHVESSCAAMSAKFDSAMESIKKKADEDDDTMAERVAADRRADSTSDIRVANSMLAGLARSVADLKKQVTRPMADLNAYADAQAKADAVMRLHGESAEPPMSGEELIPYQIRMHRKLQPHSPKWKNVELSLIAADRKAFENVLGEIRSDATQAGLNPVGLPEFQHRAIVKESPGGHKITSWVGNGTIFKQLSRPVRRVAYIGTRGQAHY